MNVPLKALECIEIGFELIQILSIKKGMSIVN